MPRRCTVCAHEEGEAINKALSDPSRAISKIAAEYRVSEDALSRHKANHLLPEMRNKMASDPELRDVDILAEMKSLYQRMKGHLEAVETTENWQAIKAFHSEARHDLELLAKLLGELDERPQVNILVSSPEWIAARAALLEALGPYPEARTAVAGRLLQLEGG
jgi:hypothetical protein